MLSEFSPFEPEVEKEGVLSKQGGGAGGTKNWKDRYFVLTDHLYYYGSKAEYAADPQNPLGRVNLLSFYVSRSDESTHEFCVHAYPKVRLGTPRCGAHCGPSTFAHPAPTPPPSATPAPPLWPSRSRAALAARASWTTGWQPSWRPWKN